MTLIEVIRNYRQLCQNETREAADAFLRSIGLHAEVIKAVQGTVDAQGRWIIVQK